MSSLGFPPDDDEATTLDIIIALIAMISGAGLAILIIKDLIQ